LGFAVADEVIGERISLPHKESTRVKKLFVGVFSLLLLTGFMVSCGSSGSGSSSGATPEVVIVFPTKSSVNVPTNVKVTASFDIVMNASSVSAASFTLKGPGGATVAGTAKLSNDGLSAVFSPSAILAAFTKYTATLTTDIQGLEGAPLAADYAWSFTTGATPDTTAPTVLSTVPADGAIAVALDTNVTATFSESMDPLTINSTSITLKIGSAPVVGAVTAPLATAVTFDPTAPLAPNTVYTATIKTLVKDVAGNAMVAEKTWNFTTRVLSALGPSPINLGLAGTYAILAESGISTVPLSSVTGNLGISPAASTSITGFSLIHDVGSETATSTQVNGLVYASDYTVPTPANLITAVANRQTAYATAAALPSPTATELYSGNLSGKTLAPGLYKWGTDVLINDDLTLAGNDNDVWVFQIAGNVTMAANKNVTLSGTALPKNVFWQVAGGTGVTINAGSNFVGIVMTATQINMGTGASIVGRLLAKTAVNIQSSTVTEPAP